MAQVQSEKLFWLAYCDIIRSQIGTGFDDKTAIFYSTKGLRGPPGGDNIQDEYTNYGVWDMGDHLLNPKNLFYTPSNLNTYSRALKTYLNWVDPGGSPGPAQITQVTNTQQDLAGWENRYYTELDKAQKRYEKSVELGMTGGQPFPVWINTNAPGVVQAYNSKNAAAQANQKALAIAYGPQASQLNTDKGNLATAMDGTQEAAGLNMKCSPLSPASAREVQNAINNGQKPADPKSMFYKPLYASQNYVSTVKGWQMLQGSDRKPTTMAINVSQGKTVAETEFGQTKVNGGVSFSYAPWISFNAGGDSEHNEESFKTDSEASQISIEVSWYDIKTVNVSSGNWDVTNLQATYPKLLPGAPAGTKELARPTQLVLASGLGYKVTFGTQLASEFDKKVNDTVNAGGSVSVFGIPISIGGNIHKSTSSTTHVGTWDNANKTFSVQPTDDAGFANVIAIVGEKLDVQQ